MDIVVKGRNVEVPDHFRTHVAEKLSRVERYDPKIIRVDVELSHESNRRQAKNCQRVQITMTGRGPAVRAEASAESFYGALDAATARFETRLRKAHGRRLDRVTGRAPLSAVAETVIAEDAEREEPTEVDEQFGDDGGPGRVVRIKNHPADPITVDQALLQMELVGHDFYLFNDVDTGLSSVVYRRRGFDYGLLRLA